MTRLRTYAAAGLSALCAIAAPSYAGQVTISASVTLQDGVQTQSFGGGHGNSAASTQGTGAPDCGDGTGFSVDDGGGQAAPSANDPGSTITPAGSSGNQWCVSQGSSGNSSGPVGISVNEP